MSAHALHRRGELEGWLSAYSVFCQRLSRGRFRALVVDYDGTLVDEPDRMKDDLPGEMADELCRLLEIGLYLGVATGRGGSVGEILRKAIPESLWTQVIIGYYSGSDIASLTDIKRPNTNDTVVPALAPIQAAFVQSGNLDIDVVIKSRSKQITLIPRTVEDLPRVLEIVHDVLDHSDGRATVRHSAHSIDLLAPGVSKRDVVTAVRCAASVDPGSPVLCIGDSGRRPGNDYELLSMPYGLSVDSVSHDPETCWNLAKAGERGAAVTSSYLRDLAPGHTFGKAFVSFTMSRKE